MLKLQNIESRSRYNLKACPASREVEDEEPEVDLGIHNVIDEAVDVSEGEGDDDDSMDAARALAAISLNKMLLN